MFCEQCGKRLKEGAAFCGNCGARVRQDPVAGNAGQALPSAGMEAKLRPEEKKASVPEKGKSSSGKGKVGLIAVIAVVFLAAAGVSGYLFLNSDSYNSRKNVKEAQKYIEAQEYEEAAACYKEALRLNAGLVDAYLGLADIYVGDGQYEEALELLGRGLRRTRDVQAAQETLNEKLTEVYLSEAEDLLERFDYVQALVLLEEGIEVTESASLEQEKERVLGLLAADICEVENVEAQAQETGLPAESESAASEAPAAPEAEPAEEIQYILPDSDSRYLTMEDLEGLTREECRIARNELFARHGRLFTDEELQAYFNSLDWYQGTVEPDAFDDSVFNEYEVANRDLITQYEEQMGYR